MAATTLIHKASAPSPSLIWDTEGKYIEANLATASSSGDESVERGLLPLFAPRTVAVVGATDRVGAVGGTVVQNLIDGQRAAAEPLAIYPINPSRTTVCGLPCYPDITKCPEKPDLAVVVTPAKTVKAVMEACGMAGVAVAIVISAGFKEIGEAGAKLEQEVLEIAGRYGIRIIGPNCLGVMAPLKGLNATFAATMALPGNIAFLSQSGAMCTAVLDWSLKDKVGFSAFVSIGSMADVDWGDLIDHLGHDPETKAILIYMETVGNAAHFLSAARTVAMYKPIVVIKAGQTAAAAQAAASHTGSLAGSHDAFLAAMRRVGVMVVNSIAELFDVARLLGKQPRPAGGRLLIITNAGGPGVLATDATALSGATVAPLESATIASLDSFLPTAWSRANPVDVLGDASAALYAHAMEVALADANVDGVLVVLSPQSVTDCTGTAKKVVEAYQSRLKSGAVAKPILCSWMGGVQISEGAALLNANGIPCFDYPDSAARTFGKIWGHTKQLMAMYQPYPEALLSSEQDGAEQQARELAAGGAVLREAALAVLAAAMREGRELLTEDESKGVLAVYGIPVAGGTVCADRGTAVEEAMDVGFPCVMKLHSKTITHKSDVGGVKLNLGSAQEVASAWDEIRESVELAAGVEHFQGVSVQPMLDLTRGIELILGSVVDEQFGPLVLFGSGGCFVEIFKDSALGLPPLTPTLAALQIASTRISEALRGGHGQRFPGVNMGELINCLHRFSQMVCDLAEFVAECDINPLLALPDRLVALDARIVLKRNTKKKEQHVAAGIPIAAATAAATAPPTVAPTVGPNADILPCGLAIRPYPSQYIFKEAAENDRLLIRPLHVGDALELAAFHRSLSESTVEQLYLRPVSLAERTCHQRIMAIADADYARTLALGAFATTSPQIAALARVARYPTRLTWADLKLVVREDAQHKGVGTALLRRAVDVAKSEAIERLTCLVRADNLAFLRMAEKLGFEVTKKTETPGVARCSLRLAACRKNAAAQKGAGGCVTKTVGDLTTGAVGILAGGQASKCPIAEPPTKSCPIVEPPCPIAAAE